MDLEHQLKKALQANDASKLNYVFEQIYNSYSKLVYFTISKYLSNTLDIEELTNDVFIRFFNQLNKIDFKSIKYYLMTSAKNAAINYLKKNKIETINIDEVTLPDYDEQLSPIYWDVIKQMQIILNDHEIQIIMKHNIEGKQLKEIAHEMNTSPNTIKSIYRRAIKKVQQKYKKEE